MSYEIDFSNEYKKVITFNQKIGKLPNPVTQMDILTQQKLVDEEVGEWLEELAKEEPTPNLLKELCDVFITMVYLDFLQLMEVDEDITTEKASQIMIQQWEDFDLDSRTEESYLICANNIKEMSNLKLMLLGATYSLVDVKAALNSVLDNNDLKIYDSLSKADEQLTILGNEDDHFIDTNTYNGVEYYCVKRKIDGKVVKSKDHPKADMSVFLGVGDDIG